LGHEHLNSRGTRQQSTWDNNRAIDPDGVKATHSITETEETVSIEVYNEENTNFPEWDVEQCGRG
jgi:hypothetical protein